MSQVKKNDSNPIGNLFKSIGDEAKRIGTETAKHVTESIDEVAKGVKDGGFIGGAVAAMDKLSLGTLAAGAVDIVLPGEDLPKPLAEGIASFVNIATGNPMGLVDAFQGFAALAGPSGPQAPAAPTTPAAPTAPGGQRTQTPESPTESYGRPRPRPEPTPASPGRIVIDRFEPTELGGGSIRKEVGQGLGFPAMGMGMSYGTVVRGTNGADTIDISRTSSGDVKVTINGESVVMSAADARNLVVMGLDGKDKITVGPGLNGITVHGGNGNDIVKVGSDGAKITGGAGNDRLIVNGDGARVDGGRGNDSMSVRGDNADVYGGRGNGRDNVVVRGDGANVHGGGGRDFIGVRGDDANVRGGMGRDSIIVRGDGADVRGGSGNDTIRVRGDEADVRGGPGRDSVSVRGDAKMTPAEKKEAIAAAKEKAKAAALEKLEAREARRARAADAAERAGGYAAVVEDWMNGVSFNDITKPGKTNDTAKKKLREMEAEAAKAISQLDKILNNPSLSFEDMIFMLMGELMKQSQQEVKGMTEEIRNQKAKFEEAKSEMNAGFNAAEEKVLKLEAKVRENPDDKGAQTDLGKAKSELRRLGEDRNDKFSRFNDSRQEQIEALKNAMNKITEMQQALSNVLNSMHQTAMNTIGNIR